MFHIIRYTGKEKAKIPDYIVMIILINCFGHTQEWISHMRILKFFTDHPASVNESYLEHMEMSGSFAFWLFAAGVCATLHAIFPFLFEKTASGIIKRLYGRMVTGRVVRSAPVSPAHQALDSASL